MVKGNDYLYKNQELSFVVVTKIPRVFYLFVFVADED